MLIIENPLKLLIIALAIMICLLIFFKIVDFFEAIKKNGKSKKDSKSDAKQKESVKETKDDSQAIAKNIEEARKNQIFLYFCSSLCYIYYG